MNEKETILKIICPLYVKKYNDLMKWGKTKTYRDGVALTKLIFEKQNQDSDWDVILVAMGWSTNDTNRLTGPTLQKEFKNIARDHGINIRYVNYTGGHTPMGYQYIVYDVEKGIEI